MRQQVSVFKRMIVLAALMAVPVAFGQSAPSVTAGKQGKKVTNPMVAFSPAPQSQTSGAMATKSDPKDPSNTAEKKDENPVRGKVYVGMGHLNQNSYKFGEWTGITGSGWQPLLNLKVGQWPNWNSNNPNYWMVSGTDVTLPSRFLKAEVGSMGNYSLSVTERGIPHYEYENALTPYSLVDGNYLQLPAHFGGLDTSSDSAWEQSVNNHLNPNLHDVNLKTQRDITRVQYRVALGHDWSFIAQFRHDHKNGNLDFGSVLAQSGGNPHSALLPIPIDYNINQIRLQGNYHKNQLAMAFAYYGSFYMDDLHSYRWDSAYLTPSGWNPAAGYENGGMGQAATPPDNTFNQMLFTGSWGMPLAHTEVNWDAAYGEEKQSQALLPYTINPNLQVTQPLPVINPNMNVDVSQADFRLVSNPISRLQILASYRYHNHADKSPIYSFYTILADASNQSTTPFYNLPYSYIRRNAKLKLAYELPNRFRPYVGFQFKQYTRSDVEVGETQEDLYQAGFNWTPIGLLDMRLTLDYGKRHGTGYMNSYRYQLENYGIYNPAGDLNAQDPANYALWSNDPLLRIYTFANRTKKDGHFSINIVPTNAITVGLDAIYQYDNYQDSTLGLLSEKQQTYTVEMGYDPTARFGFDTYATYQRINENQAGIAINPGYNQALAFDFKNLWALSGREPVYTAGLDFDVKKINVGLPRPVDIKLNASYAYASDTLDMNTGSGSDVAPAAGTFPNITTHLAHVGITGNYQATDRMGLQLGVIQETYWSNNWHFTGVQPGTLGPDDSVIQLGLTSPNYSIWWITFGLQYRFGPMGGHRAISGYNEVP